MLHAEVVAGVGTALITRRMFDMALLAIVMATKQPELR